MAEILRYTLGNPRRLPSGYTPLAYIESTGTLYINLGYTYNTFTNLVWDTEFSITLGTGNYLVLFGNRGGGTPYGGQIVVKNDNSGIYFDCGNKTLNFLTTLNFNKKFHTYIILKNGTLSAWFNDIHHADVTGVTSYDTSTQSTLFSQQTSYKACAKIYYHKAWKDNVLMVDLIPAKRNSDGVIGMFDIISQTFKTNAGTGAFIAGPEVVVLPYEYLLVEYLENNGTQRINTEYAYDSTNNTYHVLCLFLMVSAYSSYQGVYGAYTAEANSCFRLLRANNNTNLLINSNSKAGGGSTSLNVSSIFDLLESDHTYDTCTIKNKTNNTTYTATISHSNVGTNTTSTFFVFDQSSGSTPSAERIYYFKLYTGTTLVRNMIPCYRRSDLKPGMYDTVNNVFYTNAGSGEFILGPVVEESSRQLEYNNSGSNYIGKPINIHHSISNPSSTLINLGSGDFNTNSWIKLPQLQNLVNGSISFWLKVNTLKNIVIVGNEDELYYLGATRSGTGAWYHHNCGTITTYVDGVAKTTPTADTNWHHIVFTGVNLSTWTTAYLNKYISESSGWNVTGCYYDFRIYDNVLTADEVLKIYKGGL